MRDDLMITLVLGVIWVIAVAAYLVQVL